MLPVVACYVTQFNNTAAWKARFDSVLYGTSFVNEEELTRLWMDDKMKEHGFVFRLYIFLSLPSAFFIFLLV